MIPLEPEQLHMTFPRLFSPEREVHPLVILELLVEVLLGSNSTGSVFSSIGQR